MDTVRIVHAKDIRRARLDVAGEPNRLGGAAGIPGAGDRRQDRTIVRVRIVGRVNNDVGAVERATAIADADDALFVCGGREQRVAGPQAAFAVPDQPIVTGEPPVGRNSRKS